MKTMVKENNPKKQEDSKVLKKFLQDVVSSIAGKLAEEMVNLLNSKKHVNEFIVAKKMDITVNQVRNMLYKLSDYGIVSYIRKKDRRKRRRCNLGRQRAGASGFSAGVLSKIMR